MKKITSQLEITLDDIVPSNRTLVLIYGDNNSSPEFKERAGRLAESLNNADTIKAVVVTVNGSKVYRNVTFKEPDGGELPDLKAVKERFVQVLEVKNGSS